jgi:hypothetical protein
MQREGIDPELNFHKRCNLILEATLGILSENSEDFIPNQASDSC